jgi:hypothetical protein
MALLSCNQSRPINAPVENLTNAEESTTHQAILRRSLERNDYVPAVLYIENVEKECVLIQK